MSENNAAEVTNENSVEPKIEELPKQRSKRTRISSLEQEAQAILKGFSDNDDAPEGRRTTRSSTRGIKNAVSVPSPVKKERKTSITSNSAKRGRPKKIDTATPPVKTNNVDSKEDVVEEHIIDKKEESTEDEGEKLVQDAPASASDNDNTDDVSKTKADTKENSPAPPKEEETNGNNIDASEEEEDVKPQQELEKDSITSVEASDSSAKELSSIESVSEDNTTNDSETIEAANSNTEQITAN